ncbi:hypothetical protein BCR34DRAFT_666019 [Clohesyomyces aquaticus]|uniref:Sulfatase-modifying factor enzyme-like domain-containing protein n=1 Tax=Clohesyomyces aquaticus TaxID=1231657 RepID=A0A1Y1ZEH2_9PLEO|nr:hypothetical protein BCR34DRAFT_666019 [Clohesyomyces aquaticus]
MIWKIVFKTLHQLQAQASHFGNEPLLVHPNGKNIDLATGYIPLLANFTFEDKAAKGLRKRTADDEVEPPVYFSALELVRIQNAVFLATGRAEEGRDVRRNDCGAVLEEIWGKRIVVPWLFEIDSLDNMREIVDRTVPALAEASIVGVNEKQSVLLAVLDVSVHAGPGVSSLLTSLIDYARGREYIKVLILGDNADSQRWTLPSGIARYELLPLLRAQRRQAIHRLLGPEDSKCLVAEGVAEATPALFGLAFQSRNSSRGVEELLEAWLSKVAAGEDVSARLAAQAFKELETNASPVESVEPTADLSRSDTPLLAVSRAVQQLLAARHLAGLSLETAINLFHQAPDTWEPVIRRLLVRLGQSPQSETLVNGLIQDSRPYAERGALLSAESDAPLSVDTLERVQVKILRIIEQGVLSPMDRKKAGRMLSRLGDPRYLEAFAEISGGTFTMGSRNHPNSAQVAAVTVQSSRIGMFPVMNRNYLMFIKDTGRLWRSIGGRAIDQQNVPTTDLTWHDARVYCAWVRAARCCLTSMQDYLRKRNGSAHLEAT